MRNLIFVSLLHLAFIAYSQPSLPFADGTIHFKDGTTFSGQIQMAFSYDNEVAHRTDQNAEPMVSIVSEISMMTVSNQFTSNEYVNIDLGNREALLRIQKKGKLTLLVYSYTHTPEGQLVLSSEKGNIALSDSSFGQIIFIYAVQLKNQTHVITESNFDELTNILQDCSKVVKDLNKGKYTLDDIDVIVDKYNECKTS